MNVHPCCFSLWNVASKPSRDSQSLRFSFVVFCEQKKAMATRCSSVSDAQQHGLMSLEVKLQETEGVPPFVIRASNSPELSGDVQRIKDQGWDNPDHKSSRPENNKASTLC